MIGSTDPVSLVSKYYRVRGHYMAGPIHVVYIEPGEGLSRDFKKLYSEAVKTGYAPLLYVEEGLPAIRLIPVKTGGRRILPWLLSLVTLVTVFITGYDLSTGFNETLSELGLRNSYSALFDAALFTVFFMGSLLVHEMGHWMTSRRYGVPVSLPYFLPAPPLRLGFIGTFGAVINMKALPATMDELALIGLMGPVSGFIAAIITTAIGIHMSAWVGADTVRQLVESGKASSWGFAPLVFLLVSRAMAPSEDKVVLMHPLAFAGFVTLLVTFLNLLPIGQLDGGHVVRSVTDTETHRKIGMYTVVAMFAASILVPVLLFFAIIAWILFSMTGGRHVGAMNTLSRPGRRAIAAFFVYSLLLILTLPVPTG